MNEEDKAATRTGYGCLAIIALPVAILCAFILITNWTTKQAIEKASEQEAKSVEVLPTSVLDPFPSNAIVYSTWPAGNVLGDNRTVIPCSTNYAAAYDLMIQAEDTYYKIAVSEGKQLLHQQDYTPESEIKQAFIDYILEKHKQQQLLFMSLKVKMQIIQKAQEGDIPHARIYQCRILEPGSEGMVIYIQSNFLTTQPPELRQ